MPKFIAIFNLEPKEWTRNISAFSFIFGRKSLDRKSASKSAPDCLAIFKTACVVASLLVVSQPLCAWEAGSTATNSQGICSSNSWSETVLLELSWPQRTHSSSTSHYFHFEMKLYKRHMNTSASGETTST